MSEPIRVPKYVDEPRIVLKWTIDEVMTFFTLFLAGFMADIPWLGVLLGIVVSSAVRRMKNTKPKAFMLHTGYWFGFPLKETRTIPNRFDQHFTK